VSVGAWLASAAGCAPTLNEAMLNESAREARESLMVCKGYPKRLVARVVGDFRTNAQERGCDR
jgi:hypothetical protein